MPLPASISASPVILGACEVPPHAASRNGPGLRHAQQPNGNPAGLAAPWRRNRASCGAGSITRGNGSAPSLAIRVSRMRTASETVSPMVSSTAAAAFLQGRVDASLNQGGCSHRPLTRSFTSHSWLHVTCSARVIQMHNKGQPDPRFQFRSLQCHANGRGFRTTVVVVREVIPDIKSVAAPAVTLRSTSVREIAPARQTLARKWADRSNAWITRKTCLIGEYFPTLSRRDNPRATETCPPKGRDLRSERELRRRYTLKRSWRKATAKP